MKEEQRRKKKKEKLGLLHMSRAVITIFFPRPWPAGKISQSMWLLMLPFRCCGAVGFRPWEKTIGGRSIRAEGTRLRTSWLFRFGRKTSTSRALARCWIFSCCIGPILVLFWKVPGVEYGGSLRSRMASHTFQKVRNAGRNDCYVCFWSLFFFVSDGKDFYSRKNVAVF